MKGQNRGYTKSPRTTTAIILLSWPNLILWLQKLSESDRVVEAFDVSTAAWQSGISVVFSDKKVLKKAGEKNCYYTNCKITGENSNLTTTTNKYYILVIIIHLLEKNIILLTASGEMLPTYLKKIVVVVENFNKKRIDDHLTLQKK